MSGSSHSPLICLSQLCIFIGATLLLSLACFCPLLIEAIFFFPECRLAEARHATTKLLNAGGDPPSNPFPALAVVADCPGEIPWENVLLSAVTQLLRILRGQEAMLGVEVLTCMDGKHTGTFTTFLP